jgi:hypothetical protein
LAVQAAVQHVLLENILAQVLEHALTITLDTGAVLLQARRLFALQAIAAQIRMCHLLLAALARILLPAQRPVVYALQAIILALQRLFAGLMTQDIILALPLVHKHNALLAMAADQQHPRYFL